jgi:hypothetical protein
MSIKELHEHLQALARAESEPISYTEAGHFVNLTMDNPDHRTKIGHILDDINQAERAQGRPLLSALVVHGDGEHRGLPGDGFFKLARQWGLLKGHKSTDELFFYAEELKRVYAYWKAH